MNPTPSLTRGFKTTAGILFSFLLVAPAYAELNVTVNCAKSGSDGYAFEACDQIIKDTSPGYPNQLTPGETVTTAISGIRPNSSFSTSASGKADYGTLGIAAAVSMNNAANPLYQNLDTRAGNVVANASTLWRDQITISGTPGSYVDVQVNYVVDISSFYNTFSTDAFGNTEARSFGRIQLNSTGNSGGWCLGTGDLCGAPGSFSSLTVGTNLISFTTQMAVGSSVNWLVSLQGTVSVDQFAAPNPFAGSATAGFDALNTVHSYFTVLTPGSTLVSTSGHDYSMPSPVPEPEIYAMMGLGLGLMGWAARRRKQQVA